VQEPEENGIDTTDTDTQTEHWREEVKGFNEAEIEQLSKQTGNIFADVAGGNVPLGNFFAKGVWSLLSLILSLVASLIAILRIFLIVAGRRRDRGSLSDQALKVIQKGMRIGVVAVVAGVLTPAVWMVIDNVNQPMAWINQNTAIVAALFVATVVTTTLAGVIGNKRSADNGLNINDVNVAAPAK
jgi:hypothetical protein